MPISPDSFPSKIPKEAEAFSFLHKVFLEHHLEMSLKPEAWISVNGWASIAGSPGSKFRLRPVLRGKNI